MPATAALRALILPRLPRTSLVGRGRLQWSAFCRGNRSLRMQAAVFLLMVGLLVAKEIHPEWFKAARVVLIEWLRAALTALR